ncbi:hypothetical protein E3N88_26194 [Mikania micrantha]|uniref:Uncharacterized protein n=1 Tax=Mikania micrantha TaxID=192012 RepID=A0A5N6N6W2_9ASTR|nr:hypothetical protein E3N88_26194 [Mikania micrantha]
MKIGSKSGRLGPARHRPRSSSECDKEVPAAVGQNLSTAVRRTVYVYDAVKDLNHVMMPVDYVSPVEEVLYMYEPVNFGLAVEVSCIYTSLSTSGRQLRCLVLHKTVDFRIAGRLKAYPENYPGIIWHELAML